MVEKKEELLENKSSKAKKVQNYFSEELCLDLQWNENVWTKYDKLSNTYAYKMIDEGKWDVVIDHIKRFSPTRDLFKALLEDADDCGELVPEEMGWIDYFTKMPINDNIANDLAKRGILWYFPFDKFNFKINEKRYYELMKESNRNNRSDDYSYQEYEFRSAVERAQTWDWDYSDIYDRYIDEDEDDDEDEEFF